MNFKLLLPTKILVSHLTSCLKSKLNLAKFKAFYFELLNVETLARMKTKST